MHLRQRRGDPFRILGRPYRPLLQGGTGFRRVHHFQSQVRRPKDRANKLELVPRPAERGLLQHDQAAEGRIDSDHAFLAEQSISLIRLPGAQSTEVHLRELQWPVRRQSRQRARRHHG